MADPRAIHEFTTGEVEATTLLLGDFVDLDAQSGYTTLKMSVSDLGEVLLEDIEYTQDLLTVDKTIVGAINENKSVIGYSYDEYDATTAYSKDDLCIYNNTLYKALQATTGNLPTNTTYWEQTSIADEINELKSDFESSVEYGFSESVIGNFFGSPLYRKGFVLANITVPKNGNYTITISDLISGNIRIIDYKAIARVGTQYLILPYSYSADSLTNFSMEVAIDNAGIVITRGNSNDLTINDLTLILEYIKVV